MDLQLKLMDIQLNLLDMQAKLMDIRAILMDICVIQLILKAIMFNRVLFPFICGHLKAIMFNCLCNLLSILEVFAHIST